MARWHPTNARARAKANLISLRRIDTFKAHFCRAYGKCVAINHSGQPDKSAACASEQIIQAKNAMAIFVIERRRTCAFSRPSD
jgi:hypothetical protein